jgi:hypothetical protein
MVKDLILGKKKHIIKNKKMGYKSDAQRKAVHASKAEKSPAKKELIGDQDKLPEELKAKIKAAPEMKGESPLAKYGCSKKYKK